tara:strand:- start:3322 stop:4191 length:870 start_codon:yes stop_codon:yes gene_type:complete
MNKKIIGLSLLMCIYFYSCDIIEEPFITVQDEVSDSCESFSFSTEPNNSPIRKILLEDYTGHTCGNCPRAAEKAYELQEIYGDQLVIISVHAGFFSNTNTSYPSDFTSNTGDTWDNLFGNSNAGNPNGMVNRMNYPNGHILQFNEWQQNIQIELLKPVSVDLEIITSYNQSNDLICVDVQTKILSSLEDDLSLTVLIIEDKIISKQTDYQTEEGYVEEYEQNHVLRKGLNSPWGESISQEVNQEGDYLINRYSTEKDPSWDIENISVVAFVSNSNSYEVLQAAVSHLNE